MWLEQHKVFLGETNDPSDQSQNINKMKAAGPEVPIKAMSLATLSLLHINGES